MDSYRPPIFFFGLNMNFSIRMGYALFKLCLFAYCVVFLFCLSSTCVTLAVSPDYQYLIGPSVLTNVYYLLHINLVIIHIPPYPPGYHPYTPISTWLSSTYLHIHLVIIHIPPYPPEVKTRAETDWGMINRPIWKMLCFNLFIVHTYN